mmetsp:Transcript_62682/g.134582  ORF Transcript_62682/g.134582 Transcript_62682/m.134582 type:complete len:201 (-) Transcript_62682:220-822(-)
METPGGVGDAQARLRSLNACDFCSSASRCLASLLSKRSLRSFTCFSASSTCFDKKLNFMMGGESPLGLFIHASLDPKGLRVGVVSSTPRPRGGCTSMHAGSSTPRLEGGVSGGLRLCEALTTAVQWGLCGSLGSCKRSRRPCCSTRCTSASLRPGLAAAFRNADAQLAADSTSVNSSRSSFGSAPNADGMSLTSTTAVHP